MAAKSGIYFDFLRQQGRISPPPCCAQRGRGVQPPPPLVETLLLSSNKKIFKNSKALKKTTLVLFPICILPCEQNSVHYTTLYTKNTHRLIPWDPGHFQNHRLQLACEQCVIRGGEGQHAALIVSPTLGRRHQHMAQCYAKIQPSFMCAHSLFKFLLDS